MRKLNHDDPISLAVCNESAIALAFAVLKLRAECPAELIAMALAAMTRTAILVNDSDLSNETKRSWEQAILTMRRKLISVRTGSSGLKGDGQG